MKPRLMSLSAKVLERRRTRRLERVRLVLGAGALGLATLALAWSGVLVGREMRMNAAPNWAEFKVAASTHTESVAQFCENNLPCLLVVNGEEWSLVRVDHFNEAEQYPAGSRFKGFRAQTYCQTRTIAYIDSSDPAEFRDSLMHEIFHAGACLHGGDAYWNSIDPTRQSHPGVYHLGEFMGTFLHDNPEFAAWMTRH